GLPSLRALARRVYGVAPSAPVATARVKELAAVAAKLLERNEPVTLATLIHAVATEGVRDDLVRVRDEVGRLVEAGLAPVAGAIRDLSTRYERRLHQLSTQTGGATDPTAELDEARTAVHELAERAVRLVATAQRVRANVYHLSGPPPETALSQALDAIGGRLDLVPEGTPLDPAALERLLDAIDLARDLNAAAGAGDGMVDLAAVRQALALTGLLRPQAGTASAAELSARVRAELTDLAAMLDDIDPAAREGRETELRELRHRLRGLRRLPVAERLPALRTLRHDVAALRGAMTTQLRDDAWDNVFTAEPDPDVEDEANALLDKLRARAAELARTGPVDDGWDVHLGPDPFVRRRQPPPAQPFLDLSGFDYRRLRPDQVLAFFEAISLASTKPMPTKPLTPAGIAGGGPTLRIHRSDPDGVLHRRYGGRLKKDAVLPKVAFSMWFGSPLRDDVESQQTFRENLSRAFGPGGSARGEGWRSVHVTDVPRARFAAAEANPGDDTYAQERSELRWARENDILLVNRDELIHLAVAWAPRVPMLAEALRRLGRGYAAESDLIRFLLVLLFGGLYADGDVPITSGLTADVRAALQNKVWGVGIHATWEQDKDGKPKQTVANDVYAAEARHPFTEEHIRTQEANYRLEQLPLFGPRARNLVGTATITREDIPRRNSIMIRVGPGSFHKTFTKLHGNEDALKALPTWNSVPDVSEGTWLPTVPSEAATVEWEPGERQPALEDAVTALLREVVNRPGDLHTTLVRPSTDRQPNPLAARLAVLRFLAERP
ncbi:MAG TPA: hypothetical protein VJX66_24425, partial [Amycolatopsis sp.]|nr:hypothetical protein [Amycolatopsis sp.]